jgi:hypothetical protein
MDGALVCVCFFIVLNPERKGRNTKDQCPKQRKNAPKRKRKEKTLAQIQTTSLTPKPLIHSMKQIRQREGRES